MISDQKYSWPWINETCPQPRIRLTPHKCPVCYGRGNVTQGFYGDHPGTGTIVKFPPPRETCRACEGKGVIYA